MRERKASRRMLWTDSAVWGSTDGVIWVSEKKRLLDFLLSSWGLRAICVFICVSQGQFVIRDLTMNIYTAIGFFDGNDVPVAAEN